MNHCHDCNSDYATPGTCNCFAIGGKRAAAPVYVPYVPYTPWQVIPYSPPWYPYNPPYTTWTITTDTIRAGGVALEGNGYEPS